MALKKVIFSMKINIVVKDVINDVAYSRLSVIKHVVITVCITGCYPLENSDIIYDKWLYFCF